MHHTLDVETGSTDPSMIDHAGLEPWRVRQGKAKIDSNAICRPDGSVFQILNNHKDFKKQLEDLLWSLEGEVVYCHNAIFDVAWLIATLQPQRCGPIPECIKRIRWRDTQLLAKWLCNGQIAEDSRFGYSLANLVATFLPDHPLTPEFLAMKAEGHRAGQDADYWEKRGKLDVIMTQVLADYLESKVPDDMRVGLLTEFNCIVPVANSWIMGTRVDQNLLPKVEVEIGTIIQDACKALNVPATCLSSPKQMANLLFNVWGLPILSRTPSGAPSTGKDELLWLKYHAMKEGKESVVERLAILIKAKTNVTLMSKYIKTMYEALAHTRDGHIYGTPRIFGTYTGRFTYSNTTSSKDDDGTKHKWKCGIAFHQMPRKAKNIRSLLLAPEGMGIHEDDASGQESRLMAIRSLDKNMINVFQNDMNFHSMTGSGIIGMDYYEFQEKYKLEGDTGGYYTEQRQLGKLANLSCNYRIGGKALSEKAFVDYDTYMTIETGNFLVKTFNRTYPGVPQYWEDVIWDSKQKGYVDVFGGRRFKLKHWNTYRWSTESSAINVPIQGAGGSMKEIAIVEIYKKVPEVFFSLDLHDANFFWVPIDKLKELGQAVDDVLNNIDYEPYWGFKPPISLPYESKSGINFSQVK